MHYTASCLSYPSDSSLSERQRARDAARWQDPAITRLPRRRAPTPPPTPPLAPCAARRCAKRAGPRGPGRVWTFPQSTPLAHALPGPVRYALGRSKAPVLTISLHGRSKATAHPPSGMQQGYCSPRKLARIF
jgi:hypothetical protein